MPNYGEDVPTLVNNLVSTVDPAAKTNKENKREDTKEEDRGESKGYKMHTEEDLGEDADDDVYPDYSDSDSILCNNLLYNL